MSRKPARRRPRPRSNAFTPARSRASLIFGVVVRVLGFVVLLYLGGLTWFVVARPGMAPLTQVTDAVVVLTGGPGRLARGTDVLTAGSAQRMLVSGVGEHISGAQLATSVGAPFRLFAAKVDLGYGATDTRSNAIETAAWIGRHGYRSFRLVTSSAHMRRARLELALHLPPTVRIVADGVPGGIGAGGVAREFNKYLLRRAALAAGAA